jgi:hypothetical protein
VLNLSRFVDDLKKYTFTNKKIAALACFWGTLPHRHPTACLTFRGVCSMFPFTEWMPLVDGLPPDDEWNNSMMNFMLSWLALLWRHHVVSMNCMQRKRLFVRMLVRMTVDQLWSLYKHFSRAHDLVGELPCPIRTVKNGTSSRSRAYTCISASAIPLSLSTVQASYNSVVLEKLISTRQTAPSTTFWTAQFWPSSNNFLEVSRSFEFVSGRRKNLFNFDSWSKEIRSKNAVIGELVGRTSLTWAGKVSHQRLIPKVWIVGDLPTPFWNSVQQLLCIIYVNLCLCFSLARLGSRELSLLMVRNRWIIMVSSSNAPSPPRRSVCKPFLVSDAVFNSNVTTTWSC